MRLSASGLNDKMSRREFLKVIRLKNHLKPIIDIEKCTGCGLCAIDCSTKALTVRQSSERDNYQLLFRQETCDGCGVCERSCPEQCLRLAKKESETDKAGDEIKVIFEDSLTLCAECGLPLFPRSMAKKLEAKILMNTKAAWPFHLCPSCRIKNQLKKEVWRRT
jgi:ferredoxin